MKKNKEELKTYFERGDKPTEGQFSDLIDSYVDAKQLEGEANRRFVIDENGEVSVGLEQVIPEYTLSDISGNKLGLLKDGVIVKEIDLTAYVDDTNLARLVSGTVDVDRVATFKRDDNSTFTVDFSSVIKSSVSQIQADWGQVDETKPDFIKGKSKVIERTVLLENHSFDFHEIKAIKCSFLSEYKGEPMALVGFIYGGETIYFNGGKYASNFDYGVNVEDEVYYHDVNTGKKHSDEKIFIDIYNVFYKIIGKKLAHWTTWLRDGVNILMPIGGFGATYNRSNFTNFFLSNGKAGHSANPLDVDSISYSSKEVNKLGTRRVVLDENEAVISEEFFIDDIKIDNVTSWRYLEKTSDLINDGEGGFPFVTSDQLSTSEYTLSDVVANKLSLLKDGVVVKEVKLPSTNVSSEENIVLTYNFKGNKQNNISGFVNDSISTSSRISVDAKIFSSSNGVAIFKYIGEVYNRLINPVGTVLPDKIDFKVSMEVDNALFSSSFNSGGVTTKKLSLFTIEIKNDERDIRDLLINEEIPIVTQLQADIPENSQWSSITYNEVVDKGVRESNKKLFYLRSLTDDAVFGAQDLNVKFTFDLNVSYEDGTNSNNNNQSFLARVNSFGVYVKKIK